MGSSPDASPDQLREQIVAAIESLGRGMLGSPDKHSLREQLADGTLSVDQIYHEILGEAVRGYLLRSGQGGRVVAELGDVYESLLELCPAIDLAGGRFELCPSAGSQRKRSGSYYTPPELIKCLLDSALEPVLEEAAGSHNPEEAILGLRICDPACGTGRFLVAAARRMAQRLASARAAGLDCSSLSCDVPGAAPPRGLKPAALCRALRDVVGRCIYGVDLDPVAVELCRAMLRLEAGGNRQAVEDLERHVLCGNSLMCATPRMMPADRAEDGSTGDGLFRWHRAFPDVFRLPRKGAAAANAETGWSGGFDVILGNPPYSAQVTSAERGHIKRLVPIARRASNTAADFIAWSAQLVRAGGRVGLVTPKSLTYSYAWDELRVWLRPGLTHVVDVSKAWREVRLEQVLATYRVEAWRTGDLGTPRNSGRKSRLTNPRPAGNRASIKLGRMVGSRVVWYRARPERLMDLLGIIPTGMSEADQEIAERMLARAEGWLGDLCATRRGTGLQRLTTAKGNIPVLGGKDIGSFSRPDPKRFLRGTSAHAVEVCFTEPPQAVFQNIVAHITRPADHIRLIGTAVTERFACLDTVNLLTPRDPRLTPYALTGLLVSDLVNWFVYVCIYNRAVRTMHFDGCFLKKIPVPGLRAIRRLDELGRRLAEDPGAEAGWQELNSYVCRLYGIPARVADEIAAVHKPRWVSSTQRCMP